MIALEKHDDVKSLCPHCKTELATLWYQELRGLLGKRYLYFCPHCRSCLGVSHRKGFFMG
jgi:uncharacterized protein with PIN domain